MTPERMPVDIHAQAHDAAVAVAAEIDALIRERAAAGRQCVLGLATGSTPTGVYGELIRRHEQEGLSFANVVTFNLDEYWPMQPDAVQSYHRFMAAHLFDHVDIDPANIHIPDGTVDRAAAPAHCEAFEQAIRAAGGIDLQLLGIGRTGHIGFNEPGSSPESRTRLITLDRVTRMDAASDFFGEWNVPRMAITMGVGTILDASRIVLMAFGEHKATIVRDAVEGPITSAVAASFLQEHDGARMVVDAAAGAELTRCKTPWKVGSLDSLGLEWDEPMQRRAVLWLAESLGKAILKLTDEDYNEHDLQELLAVAGPAAELNVHAFKTLQKTITGWPGGKPGRPRFVPGRGVDAANGPDEHPKRVIVFSPHPDDDVISMGGTLQRLCDQGHEVHVAYQTSGNIAVFDDDAERHVDFLIQAAEALDLVDADAAGAFAARLDAAVAAKTPDLVDSTEMRRVKGIIRRTEAIAGAKYSGVPRERIHFLDLPFYETGLVKKDPIGEADIRITADLLDEIAPHMIYAAGDLSDPHGTHRVCLDSVLQALADRGQAAWRDACELWLYRGAWQEWAPHEIDMAVPLSPDEVERKRIAIFKHESQKDRALFPGPWDTREFWQRAEDRNRRTAELYDLLGLPEYQAIEGFVLWRGHS